MAFATRADLLARSNARRLAQLAVPTDHDMPPEAALRAAIAGDGLDALDDAQRAALTLALEAIDNALTDADALIVGYGIPATASSSLLARYASTIALYYLQGAERMTDDVQRAYETVVNSLKAHANGTINLLPATASGDDAPATSGVAVTIESRPIRYGVSNYGDEVGL